MRIIITSEIIIIVTVIMEILLVLLMKYKVKELNRLEPPVTRHLPNNK